MDGQVQSVLNILKRTANLNITYRPVGDIAGLNPRNIFLVEAPLIDGSRAKWGDVEQQLTSSLYSSASFVALAMEPAQHQSFHTMSTLIH